MRVIALIPAAGQGKRLEGVKPKQFLPLGDKPLVAHTLMKFQLCPRIDEIILIVPKDTTERYCQREIVEPHGISKVKKIVPGGSRRQDSVRFALEAITSPCDLVVIHDGVRPFVSGKIIEQSLDLAEEYGAAIAAVPARDSVKRVAPELGVEASLDRSKIWLAQTPQTFRLQIIKDAYQRAAEDGFYGTDDAALVERLGITVQVVPGSYENIKITTPEDLAIAELFLRRGLAQEIPVEST
jgi:2-C-methyl-D-erythritol 4-phosphate cytidylyltransferase